MSSMLGRVSAPTCCLRGGEIMQRALAFTAQHIGPVRKSLNLDDALCTYICIKLCPYERARASITTCPMHRHKSHKRGRGGTVSNLQVRFVIMMMMMMMMPPPYTYIHTYKAQE